jgi:hypothetical protein
VKPYVWSLFLSDNSNLAGEGAGLRNSDLEVLDSVWKKNPRNASTSKTGGATPALLE